MMDGNNHYGVEIRSECIGAVLVSKRFSQLIIRHAKDERIKLATYSFSKPIDEPGRLYTFEELLQNIKLEIVTA